MFSEEFNTDDISAGVDMSQIGQSDFDAKVIESSLIDFIKLELSKTKLNSLVLGVSGGIDSAVVLALSVKAIGPSNITGIIMPYKSSDGKNVDDADELIKRYGVEKYHIDITPEVDSYFENFPDADKTRRGNKMARARMSILYDVSFMKNALVIGTSNKSEILLGYGTIFGDLACAINPIGDLYKTQVRQLAYHLNIPEKIIIKPPTADLFMGQSDEGDFGFTYEEVDKLFNFMIDKAIPPENCVKQGFSEAMVNKVVSMINVNQFKRLAPKIAVLSDSPIFSDFRIEAK
jgi:NAD+ synthase